MASVLSTGDVKHVVFVHRIGSDVVVCPMEKGLVVIEKCTACRYNRGHTFHRLRPDEVRGKGYVDCMYEEISRDALRSSS